MPGVVSKHGNLLAPLLRRGAFLFVCGLGLGFGLLQVPIEIRPDVGTALAARRAGEPIFKIGQPDIVGPLVGDHADRMRALVIGAIDQEIAHARGAQPRPVTGLAWPVSTTVHTSAGETCCLGTLGDVGGRTGFRSQSQRDGHTQATTQRTAIAQM
jgi:hypothetical protein